MSNELPNHLKPVLGRVVNVTGMLKPEEALAVAVHHLAVSVTALSIRTQTVAQWADELKLNRKTVYTRIQRGAAPALALKP